MAIKSCNQDIKYTIYNNDGNPVKKCISSWNCLYTKIKITTRVYSPSRHYKIYCEDSFWNDGALLHKV